ncbi:hypothetical protein DMB95_00145 [Campylobacter sp. MIT 12-8780]|uniref:hypothetical protein n=1 Tax=unclassified Campylobacter TaxID=2593542 RepID=UPI00115F19E1|nr:MULTISPECIES: hypothetical protein [unclassified Campylobacter]NDJ26369.1 hypothetical protein [Campylobacter sp. MIT 19-121]TQR42946.1 hypothetical protein DMB95_00145 [Campylobacter sp. MIT 12-8780]
MIANKDEIRAYFEMNDENAKQVALKFDVKYRTLAHWIKSEGWQRAKAIKPIKAEVLRDELLQNELFSVQNAKKEQLKGLIKSRLSTQSTTKLDQLVLDNLLEHSTDKILLEAMSVNFIQKNIALSALIAKDELLRMQRLKREDKSDPLIIASAEKVAKIFLDLKTCLYGKEHIIIENHSNTDLSQLSNAELNALLASFEQEG